MAQPAQSDRREPKRFGTQIPPLTKTIKDILERYPDGGQILKELIQNADDAGASCVKFLVDPRKHPTDHLWKPSLQPMQEPALIAYNDALFTADDWESIGDLSQSRKAEDILKVGRFGIGFQSVHHITDLPVIVSGKYVGILDPHRHHIYEIKQGGEVEGGKLFKISEFCEYIDQAGLFNNLFGFDNTAEEFKGTLFRFPFRTHSTSLKSELSKTIYTETDVTSKLYDSFKFEAERMLLFLKHLTSIELYVWEDSRPKCIFSVSIAENSIENVKSMQQWAKSLLDKRQQSETRLFTCNVVHSEFGPTDPQTCTWLICNTIGFSVSHLKKVSQELKVAPWIGLATKVPVKLSIPPCVVPFSKPTEMYQYFVQLKDKHHFNVIDGADFEESMQKGYIFCFLPLPNDIDGLPVNIHGYFSVDSNRRGIKWPGRDVKGNDAKWNEQLVKGLLIPTYAFFIATKSILFSYSGADVHAPYRWWPVVEKIKCNPTWSALYPNLPESLIQLPVFWTSSEGGKWVRASEAVFLPSDIPDIIVAMLIQLKLPVVSLPSHITNSFDEDKVLQIANSKDVCTLLKSRCNAHAVQRCLSNLQLLQEFLIYACEDKGIDHFDNLFGLPVIPTLGRAEPHFLMHKHADEMQLYIMHKSLDDSAGHILFGLEERIVSSELSSDVLDMLVAIANTGTFNISMIDRDVMFPDILKESMLTWCAAAGKVTWNVGKDGHPPKDWLLKVWIWIAKQEMDNAQPNQMVVIQNANGLPLIPVHSLDADSVENVLLPLSAGDNQNVFYCDKDSSSSTTIPSIVDKLGFCIVEHSKCISDLMAVQPLLSGILPSLTPQTLLQTLNCEAFQIDSINIQLDNTERSTLREFLFQCIKTASEDDLKFLRSLPIHSSQTYPIAPVENAKQTPISCPNSVIFLSPDVVLPPNVQLPLPVLITKDEESDSYAALLGRKPLREKQLITDYILSHLPVNTTQNRYIEKDIALWILQHTMEDDEDLISSLSNTQLVTSMVGGHYFPRELMDTSDQRLSSFFVESERTMFPHPDYNLFLKKLKWLGLQTWESISSDPQIFADFVKERALWIAKQNGSCDVRKISENIVVAVAKSQDKLKSGIWGTLQDICFIYCQTKPPKQYIGNWKGSECKNQPLCLSQVCVPLQQSVVLPSDLPYLVGSVHPLPSSSYQGLLDGVSVCQQVTSADVHQHLQHVATIVSESSGIRVTDVSHTIPKIYNCIQSFLQTTSIRSNVTQVWNEDEGRFIDIQKIALKAPISLIPYRYCISDFKGMDKFRILWEASEIKETFLPADYVTVLDEMQTKGALKSTSLDTCLKILTHLSSTPEDLPLGTILLPNAQQKLEYAKECFYDNREWVTRHPNIVNSFSVVHSRVPNNQALHFGARSLSEVLGNPQKIQFCCSDLATSPLQAIREHMSKYTSTLDVLKELIQNADDAGATEVKFLIDWRQHPTDTLFTPEMRHWQGPALYAYNNSVFSDNDFENICELEGATKKEDATKIGRFGLGFCATYHLTDVPSFVSRGKVVFLDPQLRYLGRAASEASPGVRFNFIQEREDINGFYHDQMVPFQDVFQCNVLGSTTEYNGTLFRFPFRTAAQKESKICQEIFDECRINAMKKTLEASADLLPVFLQHVKSIELWELHKNAKDPTRMKLLLSVERDTPRFFQPLQVFNAGKGSGSLPQYTSTEQFHIVSKKLSAKVSPGPVKKSTSEKKAKKHVNPSYKEHTTQWIVSSALARPGSQAWNYTCSKAHKGLVPLTEVAISTKEQSVIPDLRSKGHVYCFLPLPIVIDDLSCKINGCFAVPSNRRTLEDLENEDRNTWNHLLIKEVLVDAFLNLLCYLATNMPTNEETWKMCFDTYYELWPVVHLSHPLSKELHTGFLTALKTCKLPLASCPMERGKWLVVSEVSVLEDCFYDKALGDIKNSIEKVLIGRDYKMGDFPSNIRRSLSSKSSNILSTVSFKTYCRDILLSDWDTDDAELRNEQLLHVLKHFKALNEDHDWLKDLLMTSKCIPSEPSGTRCKPTTLICPEGMLEGLYSVEEERFPRAEFLQNDDVKDTLVHLGMSHHLLCHGDVLERAQTIETLPQHEAKERCETFIKYLTSVHYPKVKHGSTHSMASKHDDLLDKLSRVPFLPVQQRPKGTTLPWFGDNHCFAAPQCLFRAWYSNVAFTQGFIVAEWTGTEVQDLLSLKFPQDTVVVGHFEAITAWAEQQQVSEADAVVLNGAMPTVYEYLCKQLQPKEMYLSAIGKSEDGTKTLEARLPKLCTQPCVWQTVGTSGKFLTPTQVVSGHNKTDYYPYLVKLSAENMKYLPLFGVLGVKKEFSLKQLVQVLRSIKDDMHNIPFPETLIRFIVDVSHLICGHHPKEKYGYKDSKPKEKYTEEWNNLSIHLPSEKCVMTLSSELAHKEDITSSEFLPPDLCQGRTQYVHPSIPKQDAKLLGVVDVLSSIMCQFKDDDFLTEVEFGQREQLHTRLNNILSQYPSDVSIFKEFVQNAEDATASEIAFVIDRRHAFEEKSLFADHRSWKSLQKMPALLVFNNRKFKEKDIESIKELGVGGKGESLGKIGRFGIGFNVAYHVTDCPMFVSYGKGGQAENFCAFDPNFHYVPKAGRRKQPGARYIMKNKDGKNSSEHFKDQFLPYLGGGIIPKLASAVEGCFEDSTSKWPSGYAVFRLPLTRLRTQYTTHTLTKLEKGHPMSVEDLQTRLEDLKIQAPSMLLFLSHLKRISVFEISETGQIVKPWSVAVSHSEDGARKCAEFAQSIHKLCSQICNKEGLKVVPPSVSATYKIELKVCNSVQEVLNTPNVSGNVASTHTSSVSELLTKFSQRAEDRGIPSSKPKVLAPPKQWVVCKRFGVADVPKELLYLAGDNHLFPLAGVAVPLPDHQSTSTFTGQLFTHLPLPRKSGVPAHVNGHFWVDQSRKHLENTGSGKTEPLKNWNELLSQHVVSQAYLEALLKCRKFVSKDDKTSIDWFYKLIILHELGGSIPSSLNVFHFKEVLYQLLLEIEAQVLLADELKQTGKSPNWLALTANQSNPMKGWFFSGQESVKKVLLSLGVQITVAPMSVNRAFNIRRPVPSDETTKPDYSGEVTAKPDYSGEVTPELARKYLRQPGPHSCVEESVIVPALIPLLRYILSDISSPEECSKVNGLPLMLTSNRRLQDINTNAPLFRREFAHLLPESVWEYFVSEKLIEDIHLATKLIILQLVQHVTPQFVAQHTELVKLPIVNFAESNVELVINLWHYINSICKDGLDCFKELAIIPTNQSTLVSVGMSKSILREYGSVHLLKKLGLPVVDFTKFTGCADNFFAKCNEAVRLLLAVESKPDQVLHVIQTAKDHGYLCPCADVTDSDAYDFVGFVVKSKELSHYKNTLKSLSIYKTVTGDWQSLEDASRVYALPQSSVPHDGLEKIHSPQCFIIHIQHHKFNVPYYQAVGVEVLLETDFYQKVIIPNFCSLSTEAMIIHLKHMPLIRNCDVLLKLMSTVRFIWDERKNRYCTVTDYHDPEEPLLKAFLPENHFPPPPWSEELTLLKRLGLRSTVTDNQWIEFARSITTLPKDEAQRKSQMLLLALQGRIRNTLFSHNPVSVEDHQQALKLFLHSIADIHLVPQEIPPEIDLLFHQLKGLTYSTPEVKFVPFRNSFLCEPDQASLVCFRAINRCFIHVEQLVGQHIRVEIKRKEFIVQALGMKVPTDKDVCRNLLKLCLNIEQCTLSSKQSSDVTQRLQRLFTSHYDFLSSSDLRRVKSELNEKKCLFLPSEDGATFTICRGKDLVRNHRTSRPYRAYIPCVPPYLRDAKYSSFLLEVGVTSQITAKHFIQLLTEISTKGALLDPNVKECVIAVYEDLVKELRSPRNTEAVECVEHYPFIPLPDENVNIVLHASNELVLNDAQWIKNRLNNCSDYHFIRPPPPLPVGGEVTLPACLKVQKLSTLICEELDEAAVLDRENRCVADLRAEMTQTDDEEAEVQVCPHAGPLVHFLQSEEFGNGLRRLISDRLDGKPLAREHEDCIQEVQELQVKCVYAIRTVLKNSKTGDIIPGSENSDVPCYLDDKSNPKCLYVRFHPRRAEVNRLLLVKVLQRLMRLLKYLVDASHLQCLLESCDPERVSVILDDMHVKPYTPQGESVDGYSAEGEEGKGTTIENFEYIVTCNFREDELVKYCKADSETVVARVIKVERSTSSGEYPYPITVHVKASVDDDPEVKKMNSLLVCKFLPPGEEEQLRKLYGSQSETNPSDLSGEKSIVLELPCSDVQHLMGYLSTVVKNVVESYSNEQVYFSIERLLFQLHFDCVHRHKQPELFLHSLDTFLTVVDALMPRETFSMFLDSLHTKAQTMRSKIEPGHLQEEDSEDDQELSVDYSQMSSWSVPQQPVEEAPSSGQNVQHGIGSTYQGAPVLAHAPLGPIQRQRRRGGRRSNYPLHPGPASMPGGGSYIWSSGPPPAHGQVWPSPIAQGRPEPPPRVSEEDARVWLRDVRETVAVVNHLREEMIQADILGQDGEIERRDVFAFPAAICFYAHEIVLKCLKALFFAYCGLPGQLVECSNLVELHQELLKHEETPQEVRALEPFVHLVSGHGSTCCCYSSFDPPITANDKHSPIVAREVLEAAMDFLTGILRMRVIESHYSHVPANQHLQQEEEQDRPYNWEGAEVLVPMDPLSREYREIQALFRATMPQATILKIERVQNETLWRHYRDCRRRIKDHFPSAGEKKLFHGTRQTSPQLIYAGDIGFDVGHSRVGMWGRGSYFAVNASYSSGYSHRKRVLDQENCQMLVARVLTGACIRLKPNSELRFPPGRTDAQGAVLRRRYDSVQGITGGSEVYIVYENEQSYPAYLITYT
jgi:hypothetical protein